jgi:hypothetical protein
MPRDTSIKTIILSVHLGRVPTFDVRADDNEAASIDSCHAYGTGTGPADAALLQELLKKIAAAYGVTEAMSLCLDGHGAIKPDAGCP